MHKKNGNIFDKLPDKPLADELIEQLLQQSGIRIERIISTGQTTPDNTWYDQSQDEWVILLKGHAKLLFEDHKEIALKSGDYVFIPAHQKHRVTWTAPNEVCVWLACHLNTQKH